MPASDLRRRGKRGRQRTAVLLAVALAISFASASAVEAVSVPSPPKPKLLTVSGSVRGRLAKNNLVLFKIVASDPLTFADLESVEIALLLHGQTLQNVAFLVGGEALKLGDLPPVKIAEQTFITAGFFRVNPHSLRRIRHTFRIDVTFWARIREGIPKGTTFRVIARSTSGKVAYARERVAVSGGFLTWGTFGIGAILALLLGAFLANLRWARRHRLLQPSIWDLLERRLREERARPPALATLGADGVPP